MHLCAFVTPIRPAVPNKLGPFDTSYFIYDGPSPRDFDRSTLCVYVFPMSENSTSEHIWVVAWAAILHSIGLTGFALCSDRTSTPVSADPLVSTVLGVSRGNIFRRDVRVSHMVRSPPGDTSISGLGGRE